MSSAQHKEGYLLKWTNYMKGFQRRYFVLDGRSLAYYRSPSEMAEGCRGSLNLLDAKIETTPGNNIIIQPGGSRRTGQIFHLRATSDQERQDWVNALQLAKQLAGNLRVKARKDKGQNSSAKAMFGETASKASSTDATPVKRRSSQHRHVAAEVVEFDIDETVDDDEDEEFYSDDEEALESSHAERPPAFVMDDYKHKFHKHERHIENAIEKHDAHALRHSLVDLKHTWTTLLQDIVQREVKWDHCVTTSEKKRKDLESTIESLAKENRKLERSAELVAERGLVVDPAVLAAAEAEEEEEDEFFDATSEPEAVSREASTTLATQRPPSPVHVIGQEFVFRTAIPFKPNKRVSLWGIMKNCIGKDLSKIPMPVNFNEPISFTQRLSEDLEYSDLLDRAAKCESPQQRLAYVAAFTVSSFSSGADRLGKPFNPLLGETFELDRRHTKGWRALLEQVSHHPPIAAFHTESDDWTFWQEFSMDSKFRGKYLEIIPTGVSHLIFKHTGDHFTWRKVHTTIHNIIVGKLWMENTGTMEIVNHRTKDICSLEYLKCSLFSNSQLNSVRGEVKDASGRVHFSLEGKWHQSISVFTPEMPDEQHVIWERNPHVPNYDKMYGFTQMAIESNVISPYEKGCAITDARFRPDKNLMEIGEWDMANRVKHLLEEAQRHRRREYEHTKTKWTPAWFEQRPDPVFPNRKSFQYKGGYWEAKANDAFHEHHVVDVFDIRAVESKDPEAAEQGRGAMLMNDKSDALTQTSA
eukprot:m.128643 g.128643  ORF g.128643 m.128643 type:complete len:754 (-) comp15675_c0_seq1:435-2696(-)